MIENYFVKGARFSWMAPSAISTQPKDGAIVDTPRVTAPMFYVGLDDEIVDHSLPNVSTLGLKKDMGIPHTWLSYIHGRTAKVSTMGDVLTGFMSGCWIAAWNSNGRCVGHLGTVESAAKNMPPNSTVKNTFAMAMPQNVMAYNPASAFDAGDIMPLLQKGRGKPSAQVLSLVTATNQFYSILLVERTQEPGERGIWICAGKKLMPGVPYATLSRELIVTRPRG